MRDLESEINSQLDELEETDTAMYEAGSPTGKFPAGAMNQLIAALQPILAELGQDPFPEMEEDTTVFPADLTKVLTMIQDIVDRAIEQDVIDSELQFVLDGIKDERGISLLAARLSMLAKDRNFRKFLKEPAPEPEPTDVIEEPEQDGEDIDALFLSRI